MTIKTGSIQTRTPVIPIKASYVIVGTLLFLAFLGFVSSVGRLFLGLGAATGLSDGYPWGIWIGFDFLLIAFAGVGFTMVAVVHLLRLERYRAAIQPAVLAGLMGYTAVLLLLFLDLGRPDRFYSFIISWNPHSPLFEVSWCVFLYTMVLAVENGPVLLERLHWELPARLIHKFMIPVAIAGVTLSSLHQSTLGTLYLNMPHRLHLLWYTPVLPLLFFVSSIMAGLSLAVILYMLTTRILDQETSPSVVSGLAKGAAWVTLLYVALRLGDLWLTRKMPALLAFDKMSQLAWCELGLGAILPMILLFVPAVRTHELGRWIGPGLILFGVAMSRFNATLFAQSAPVGASYSPHILEWLSTIGILAGAALAWYASVRLLVIFESVAHQEHARAGLLT